jgi:hypothetical protein
MTTVKQLVALLITASPVALSSMSFDAVVFVESNCVMRTQTWCARQKTLVTQQE